MVIYDHNPVVFYNKWPGIHNEIGNELLSSPGLPLHKPPPIVRSRPTSGFEAGLIKRRREASEAARRAARRKQIDVLRTYRIGRWELHRC